MGVDIKDIVEVEEIELRALKGRTIALDAMNTLYQFLSIIRQRDGTPLKDSKGRITSHLSGLLYRTSNLVELEIRPVFVFDGEPPELKSKTLESRRAVRAEAKEARREALKAGKEREARKYAQRAATLSGQMVDGAKTLLDAMGIPWIQAPGEGEAQAARMVQRGDAWGVSSQDFDSLLFGAPRLVRNVAITGKRKLPGKDVYKKISPEIIELNVLLDHCDIDRRQLVILGILVGTDYNSGIKGIGPKRALERVRKRQSLEDIMESDTEIEEKFGVDPHEVEKIFLEPNVTDDYEVEWNDPDSEAIKDFLCEKHDFSESRVETGIERLEKGAGRRKQQSLEEWI